MQTAKEHLQLVTKERSSYRAAVEESKRQARATFKAPDGSFQPPPVNCDIKPASNAISMHYSFDFAQQFHYPSNPFQPGPVYFMTPRKAALFGICCEAIPRQINFVIDEASDVGKGANAVVSMLDYFFNHHGLGETTVSLHADNCTGQNKNNTMMQYLMWRVLTGLHHNINISFMVVGHTKFAPDGCFGMLKRALRRTEVSSLADIEQVIQSSSVVNECQLVGSQTGEMIVPVRDWASFLAPHFRKLTGIKKFHHFHFSTSFPGVVKLQQQSDSPEERSLLKDPNWKPVATDLPPIIQPTGLSFECKQYLFEKIREFCREDTRSGMSKSISGSSTT